MSHALESVQAHEATHPVRGRVLALFQGDAELSVSDIQRLLPEIPIGKVAYHVKRLRELGVLIRTRVERRGGTLQTYYRTVIDLEVRVTARVKEPPPAPVDDMGRPELPLR